MDDDLPDGLSMTVREADHRNDAIPRERSVQGEALDEDTLNALFQRLEALPDPIKSQAEFALRSTSKPAPRAGETIEKTFPPDASSARPDAAQDDRFTLRRYQPEGEVDLAPKITMTFSQGVVPLTGQDDAAQRVPASISPAVEGTWRWAGTQTAIFDPADGRFPMSTSYTVTPDGDLRTHCGASALEDATAWTFKTPTLRVTQSVPSGKGVSRTPLIFLAFNQKIDAETLIDFVQLRAGGKTIALEAASKEEIDADDRVRAAVANAQDDRWLAVRPTETLPAGTDIQIRVLSDAPSAEGPRTTNSVLERSFRTYDPLRVEHQNCEAPHPCPPSGSWRVSFNNILKEDAFESDYVDVSPPVENLEVDVQGGSLRMQGKFKARTTYTVQLHEDLEDEHGQKLGASDALIFEVGEAPKMLGASTDMLTSLDPALKGKFPFYTQNYDKFKVRAWRVRPEDWGQYLQAREQHQRRSAYADPNNANEDSDLEWPGELAFEETVDAPDRHDEIVEQFIDLQRALNDEGYGHVILQIQVVEANKDGQTSGENDKSRAQIRRAPRYIPEILTWVQVTDLSLHASWDDQSMLAWAAKLADGAPVEDVQVRIVGRDDPATPTGKDGVAKLPLDPPADRDSDAATKEAPRAVDSVLVAQKGQDSAMLPERIYAYNAEEASRWSPKERNDSLLWHIFDDRGMYQPGETVHVKGWVRYARVQRDDAIRTAHDANVRYTVEDPRGNTLHEGTFTLNENGAFDLSFDLPDDTNLGHALLNLRVDGAKVQKSMQHISHRFQIQEFKRPEFEVSVDKSEGPYVVGEHAELWVNAAYYAGGGLSEAPVRWTFESMEGRYTPPNQNDYTFGRWNPWWWWGRGPDHSATHDDLEGFTDAQGEHRIDLRFERAKPALPMRLSAHAAVQDINRQTWQANTDLLVHPSTRYVGLRTEKTFIDEGESMEIDAIVTDIEGEIQPDHPVYIEAVRLDYRYKNGEYKEVEKDKQRCELTSAKDAQTCEIQPENSGQWRVRAIVYDDDGRPNMSELRLWAGATKSPPTRRAEQGEVRIIPDKEDYAIGDTATLRVLAPFADAEALMSVRQAGIVSTERRRMDGEELVFEIDIDALDSPNIGVQVDLVGAEDRVDAQGNVLENGDKRPAWASGNITLRIPPVHKELDIELTPQREALSPGDKTYVDVHVRDAEGQSVSGADLTVFAVDEAILALSDYTLKDPIDSFFPMLSQDVQDMDLHDYLVLASSEDLLANDAQGDGEMMYEADGLGALGAAGAPQMSARSLMRKNVAVEESADDAASSGEEDAAIDVRKNFNPLAVFAASETTDEQGRTRVGFDLPDNLTRYRVMAVAAKGDDFFGTQEQHITARLPLMVRPALPRFLNYGDALQLPVVLQNQTEEDMEVQVALRASNLKLTGASGQRVTVPAHDRVEVRFDAQTDMPGTAHIQVVATSGEHSDATTIEFPVWTPATTEAFATYGTLDDDGDVLEQPVVPPKNAIKDFGSVDLTTSSTAVQSLTDALIYLVGYPFESAEHIASRLVGITVLTPVLSAFESEELPKEEELKETVKRDLERLRQLQRPDGGFYLWSPRDDVRFPFAEVHVAHGMFRAKNAGYAVHEQSFAQARRFVQNVDRYIPNDYSEAMKNAVRAYALYVRNLMGDDVLVDARDLLDASPPRSLSLESIGWLFTVVKDDKDSSVRVQELTRYVENLIDETAATAQFTTSYEDRENVLMHSDRRTDAILLEGWMHTQPDSELIVKLVRGLETSRTRGRWGNTQENSFVLLALEHYFQTYEAQTPNFVANLWLGEGFAGEHRFKGRESDYQHTPIPMRAVVDAAGEDDVKLTLQKLGKGRLYYRLGMRYALESLTLDPAEHGFSVERSYEGVDSPDAARQRDDGTWDIRLGERVRVRVTMVAPARRQHVALVDKLPAGFEAINSELALSESVPEDADKGSNKIRPYWWGFARWYTHENLRDERAEAFAFHVPAGVYEYSYVVRATTPGEFIVPPATAEEMYYPETFGRTGSDTVVIE